MLQSMRITETLRVLAVGLACLAGAASATSGPKLVPATPAPQRTETVSTETAVEGLTINALPIGAAAWRIVVENNTDAPVSVLWDESSFVASNGDSGGRLIRGETRRMDVAKAQPPTPVAAHARVSETILVEKLTEAEKAEADHAEFEAKWGGVAPDMNESMAKVRESTQRMIRGGRIDLRIDLNGTKQTWTGRVSS